MTIVLLKKWLIYDVDQLVHRYAKMRQDNPELLETADLSGDDSSDNLLKIRLIVTGTAKLRRKLAEYLTKVTDDADDANLSKDSWSFTFTDEADFDSWGMAELMHWFVVRFAVWQWLKIFSPAESKNEKEELDELESELDDMISDLAMPTKERRDVYNEDGDEDVIVFTEEDE